MVDLMELLTVSECARRLGLSAIRVSQFLADGRLASIPSKYGRFVEPAELERFAREREAKRVESVA